MDNENKIVPDSTAVNAADRKINKKGIFIAAAAVLAVIVIMVWIFAAHTPFGNFKGNVEKGNIAAAESIYTENKDNEKFTEKCRSYLADHTLEIYDKYIKKDIYFDSAINTINSYAAMYTNEEIIRSINDIEASRTAFSQGEVLLGDKKYAEAIEMFSNVIQDDTENYEAAQNKIEAAADMLCTEAIEKANRLVEQKKFTEAYSELDNLDFDDERIETQKQSIISAYEKYVVDSADRKMTENDYAGAIKIYSGIPSEMASDNLKRKSNEAEEKYVDYVSKLADEYIKKQDYSSALGVIQKEIKKTKVSALDKLLNSTENEYSDNIISQAEKFAAENNYAEAFRTIIIAEESISTSKLKEAEQKYRNLLDSQQEIYSASYDYDVSLTYSIKYYTDYYETTAYKSFVITSIDIGDFSFMNDYVMNWLNQYVVPYEADRELTRSQYEEMYLYPHEYWELEHVLRDSLYIFYRINKGDGSYSEPEVHMMEMLYGTEITAQSLYGGLLGW